MKEHVRGLDSASFRASDPRCCLSSGNLVWHANESWWREEQCVNRFAWARKEPTRISGKKSVLDIGSTINWPIRTIPVK